VHSAPAAAACTLLLFLGPRPSATLERSRIDNAADKVIEKLHHYLGAHTGERESEKAASPLIESALCELNSYPRGARGLSGCNLSEIPSAAGLKDEKER
jgi:hypothetical protein